MNKLLKKIIDFFSQKEFLFSVFLVFSVLFPWLNSFEIIFFQTQKTFLNFCILLSFLVFSLFKIFPNYYENFLGFFFSKKIEPFLSLVKWGCDLNRKHPYLIGFFYGMCFLSFLLRFEYPDSNSFFFINSTLLVLRNFFIIPFIGVLGLVNWLSQTFSALIENNIISETELSIILTETNQFSQFDKKLFLHLPFFSSSLSVKNGEKYPIETRRTMFSFARIITSIPGKETLKQTTTSVVGTTVTGSATLTLFFAGGQADKAANSALEQTLSNTSKVLNNPEASQKEKDMASYILREVEEASHDWAVNAGSTQAFRGFKFLFSESSIMSKFERYEDLRSQASTLYTIGQ